jgi:hypothetical protein
LAVKVPPTPRVPFEYVALIFAVVAARTDGFATTPAAVLSTYCFVAACRADDGSAAQVTVPVAVIFAKVTEAFVATS